MNALALCLFAALAVVSAEPPSGYNYQRPSGGGHSSGGGGGGGFIGGGATFGGGGGYIQESTGYSSSEGQNVDAQLLEKIRQIILKEESKNGGGGGGGFGGGHGGGVSSQYGAPSAAYGVPSYSSRVVGVDLEGVRQAIQVAQYRQTSQQAGGGFQGYSRGPAQQSYSAPSSTYGANF